MDPIIVSLGGGAIAALVTAVGVLWKKYNEVQDKRLEDQKLVNQKLTETLPIIAETTKAIYDSLPGTKRGQ